MQGIPTTALQVSLLYYSEAVLGLQPKHSCMFCVCLFRHLQHTALLLHVHTMVILEWYASGCAGKYFPVLQSTVCQA